MYLALGPPKPEVGDGLGSFSLFYFSNVMSWRLGLWTVLSTLCVSYLRALGSLILLCLECSSSALQPKSTFPSWGRWLSLTQLYHTGEKGCLCFRIFPEAEVTSDNIIY